MKKLLSILALLPLTFAGVEAQAVEYRQFKVITAFTYGYSVCGFDSSVSEVQALIDSGTWKVQSITPLDYRAVNWLTGDVHDTVRCIGQSVVLYR